MGVPEETPECLSNITQQIMDATNQYIVTPTEENMPSWIASLDEPEKTEKTNNYMKYGSPNVGSYFAPHVTYAAVSFGVEGDFDAVAEVAGTTPGDAICSFAVAEIALGVTGPSGTVLGGQDLASTTASPITNDTQSDNPTNSTN